MSTSVMCQLIGGDVCLPKIKTDAELVACNEQVFVKAGNFIIVCPVQMPPEK